MTKLRYPWSEFPEDLSTWEDCVNEYKQMKAELEALREVEKRARMFDYKDRIDDLNTPFHKLYNDLRNALKAVEKVRGDV